MGTLQKALAHLGLLKQLLTSQKYGGDKEKFIEFEGELVDVMKKLSRLAETEESIECSQNMNKAGKE